MARIRSIKPSIMDNEELARCTPLARVLYPYLWMLADREGRMEDRPGRIGKQALGFDRVDCAPLLDELQAAGFITRYEVDGLPILEVCNFLKHQRPHVTERDSTLPGRDGLFTVHPRYPNGGITSEPAQRMTRPAPAKPLGRPPKAEAPAAPKPQAAPAAPVPQEAPPRPASTRGTRIAEDWAPSAEMLAWAREQRPDLDPQATADAFRDYWTAKPGKDGAKLDWLATWRNWVRGQRAQQRNGHAPAGAAYETPFQRTQRERAEEFAPRLARKAPGAEPKPEPIEMESRYVPIRTGH
jgi:hypothetical protein